MITWDALLCGVPGTLPQGVGLFIAGQLMPFCYMPLTTLHAHCGPCFLRHTRAPFPHDQLRQAVQTCPCGVAASLDVSWPV